MPRRNARQRKAKPKRAPAPRAPRSARRSKRRPAKSNLHPYAYAITHPFAVPHVRVPDTNSYPSCGVTINQVLPLSTTADGNFAFAIHSRLNALGLEPAVVAANGDVTWAGGTTVDIGEASTIISTYKLLKVTACGVRVSWCGPMGDSMSGVIFMAQMPWTGTPHDNISELQSYPLSRTLAAQSLITTKELYSRRVNSVLCDTYQASNYSGDTGWTSFQIGGMGLPASKQCVLLTIRLHLEAVPVEPGVVEAHPSLTHSPVALQQADKASANPELLTSAYDSAVSAVKYVVGEIPAVISAGHELTHLVDTIVGA